MSGMSLFDISGRAMQAQLVRLNTTASNLANANAVTGSEGAAYRSMKPVFRTVMDGQGGATVAVDRIDTTTMTPDQAARTRPPAGRWQWRRVGSRGR